MNYAIIFHVLGWVLKIESVAMILPLICALIYREKTCTMTFLICIAICLAVGFLMNIKKPKNKTMYAKEGFISVAFSWIVLSLFGCLPFIISGSIPNFTDAVFETVSGFTTTGASILTDVEALPKSLLFWRSSTHYIGGLGVVVFLLLVMPGASPFKLKLTNMEMSSLSKEGYRYKSSKIISVITAIYVGLTIASCLSLWVAGMPFFDAINHAFSIAATGGFSPRNLSVGAFGSDLINIIVLIFMVVCAMHFGLIYATFATRSFKPMNNTVVKYYFGSIAVCSLIIMFSLMSEGGYDHWGRAAMDATFTVVSYMSTAGFGICDNSSWPWIAGIVLLFVSFQCGCSGSTTGGIKVDRILIAFKAVIQEMKQRLHPTAVSRVRLSGHHLSDSSVKGVMTYIVAYVFLTLISILLVLVCGESASDAVSGVIASIGSVGPGLGELGAMDNYSAQSAMAKFIYAFDMFLGRVEIYPVLIVISMMFRRDK